MDILSKITAAITLLWIEAASAAECVQLPTPKGGEAAINEEMSSTIRMGTFGIGSVLIAAGLLKLKQAADTQGKEVKYGDGLWRLTLGAVLASAPAVVGTNLLVLADQNLVGMFDAVF